jgi:hypothetical protein
VLDVGSGPVCRLGQVLPPWEYAGKEQVRRARIVCSDPLADEYKALREKVGIESRAPVLKWSPRECRESASLSGFDLVVASNSLDHSEDPLSVLREMCNAAKDEGHVIVCGYIDEANAANGYGLHRWNMRAQDGGLYVQKFGEATSVTEMIFEGRPVVSAQNWPEKRWFEVVFGPLMTVKA